MTLCTAVQYRGGSWSPSGKTIVFSDVSEGLLEVDVTGGKPRVLLPRIEKESASYNPVWLVEGKTLLATKGSLLSQKLISFDSRKRRLNLREGAFATVSTAGYILYQTSIRDGGLWALGLNASKEPGGAEPVALSPMGTHPTVSNEGTLLFAVGLPELPAQLVMRDRAGKEVYRDEQPMAFKLGRGHLLRLAEVRWDVRSSRTLRHHAL